MNPSIDEIATVVARHHGIAVCELKGPSRDFRCAGPRHLVVSIARALTNKTNGQLAAYFNRNRSTVCNWVLRRWDDEAMVEMWRKMTADLDPPMASVGRCCEVRRRLKDERGKTAMKDPDRAVALARRLG